MNPVNADERSRPKTRNQWDKLSESSTDGDAMGSPGKNAGGDRVEVVVEDRGRKRRRRSVDSSDRNKEMDMMRGFEFVEDFVIGDREKEEKETEEEREKEKEKEKEVVEKDKSKLLAMVRMMDLEFVEDLVKGERERREREKNKEKEKEKQKEKEEEKEKGKEEEKQKEKEKEKEKQKGVEEEKEKGKEEEKEKEKDKEKQKEKEEEKKGKEKDKSKWLALVDVGSASRNNDTKCVALVDSDDSSDDVVFVGETHPIYKNKANNRMKVISLDDDKRGDKQLVIAYDEVDSSTSKRRRVDSSFNLSHYYSSDSEDFESSSSSSSDDDDSEDGDFSVNIPSSVFKRADEKGKDAEEGGEKRKGIVSRLRSSSNSKPLDNDEREKQNYSDLRLGEDSGGEDSEQKRKTIAKKRGQRARSLNVKDILLNTVLEKESRLNERFSRPEENAPPLPLKFRFPDEEDETPPVKEDWEVEIDNLFADLEMGILQPEAGSSAQTMEDNGKADDAKGCCHPGGHLFILDEQIGVQCKYCLVVFMEMKHVYPDFVSR